MSSSRIADAVKKVRKRWQPVKWAHFAQLLVITVFEGLFLFGYFKSVVADETFLASSRREQTARIFYRPWLALFPQIGWFSGAVGPSLFLVWGYYLKFVRWKYHGLPSKKQVCCLSFVVALLVLYWTLVVHILVFQSTLVWRRGQRVGEWGLPGYEDHLPPTPVTPAQEVPSTTSNVSTSDSQLSGGPRGPRSSSHSPSPDRLTLEDVVSNRRADNPFSSCFGFCENDGSDSSSYAGGLSGSHRSLADLAALRHYHAPLNSPFHDAVRPALFWVSIANLLLFILCCVVIGRYCETLASIERKTGITHSYLKANLFLLQHSIKATGWEEEEKRKVPSALQNQFASNCRELRRRERLLFRGARGRGGRRPPRGHNGGRSRLSSSSSEAEEVVNAQDDPERAALALFHDKQCAALRPFLERTSATADRGGRGDVGGGPSDSRGGGESSRGTSPSGRGGESDCVGSAGGTGAERGRRKRRLVGGGTNGGVAGDERGRATSTTHHTIGEGANSIRMGHREYERQIEAMRQFERRRAAAQAASSGGPQAAASVGSGGA